MWSKEQELDSLRGQLREVESEYYERETDQGQLREEIKRLEAAIRKLQEND